MRNSIFSWLVLLIAKPNFHQTSGVVCNQLAKKLSRARNFPKQRLLKAAKSIWAVFARIYEHESERNRSLGGNKISIKRKFTRFPSVKNCAWFGVEHKLTPGVWIMKGKFNLTQFAVELHNVMEKFIRISFKEKRAHNHNKGGFYGFGKFSSHHDARRLTKAEWNEETNFKSFVYLIIFLFVEIKKPPKDKRTDNRMFFSRGGGERKQMSFVKFVFMQHHRVEHEETIITSSRSTLNGEKGKSKHKSF